MLEEVATFCLRPGAPAVQAVQANLRRERNSVVLFICSVFFCARRVEGFFV